MEPQVFEFGRFRLDGRERVLLCDRQPLPLPPKAFDTLLLLVSNHGRALDKEDMMRQLWPDTFVEEVNLAQQVSLLRKTLGENRGEPQYIETVPRRGYRFIANVREVDDLSPVATDEKSRTQQARPDSRTVAFLVVAGIALVAGSVIARFLSVAPGPPKPLRFTPLVVDTTLKLFPAWSPNGKTLAYVGEAKGKLQIFTRTLGAATSTQITQQSNDCFRPFWAPSGERIYYLAYRSSEAVSFSSRLDVWSVGAAGGVPELVWAGTSAAAISPDGRTLALLRLRGGPGNYPGEVWLASPPTAEPIRYTTLPFADRRYIPGGDLHFSPDGSKLAVSIFLVESRPEIWILPFPSGKPYRVLPSMPVSAGVKEFSWMPNGRDLVFSDSFLASSNPHLFFADIERDRIWPMTAGAMAERSPAVSPDGKTIAVASMEGAYDLAEVRLDGSGLRSLGSTPRNEVTPGWSPLGSKTYAYATDRSGIYEIWLRNEEEGSERPLVTQKDFGNDKTSHILDVTFSPDGQRIAYRRIGDKDESIWISTIAGDPPMRLPREPGGVFQRGPSWSPDGNWIAYYSTRNEKSAILKAKVGGTDAPVLLRDDVGEYPRWSPDGESLLCGIDALWIVSKDGKTRKSISQHQWTVRGWSRDGSKIFGIRMAEGRRVVLAQIDVRSGIETVIGELGPYPAAFAYGSATAMIPFRGYSLSTDGKSFLTSIFRARGDIWLISGFDPAPRRLFW
jgi:Tol biopolymer transport system component/DNA-binding winged helix-turn-helix (wHTH) protein